MVWFLKEMMWYFVPMQIAHLMLYVVAAAILLCLKPFIHIEVMPVLFLGLCLSVALPLFGSIAHALWSKYVFGVYYWAPDYAIDFTPYFPIKGSQVDLVFGDQKGYFLKGDLLTLRLIWGGVALIVWLSSFCSVYFLKRFISRDK